MRWTTSPAKHSNTWYPWFAWHPVRLNHDRHEPGRWVWLERIERMWNYGWDDYEYSYRDGKDTEKTTGP